MTFLGCIFVICSFEHQNKYTIIMSTATATTY